MEHIEPLPLPRIGGRPTIERALQAGTLSQDQAAAVRAAMDCFASALLKWRRTHHGVAGRMLGDRRGTGDTEGQAYLAQGMTIPVFTPSCPLGHDTPAAPTGCPFGHGRTDSGPGESYQSRS
jgi:hypothetical protein